MDTCHPTANQTRCAPLSPAQIRSSGLCIRISATANNCETPSCAAARAHHRERQRRRPLALQQRLLVHPRRRRNPSRKRPRKPVAPRVPARHRVLGRPDYLCKFRLRQPQNPPRFPWRLVRFGLPECMRQQHYIISLAPAAGMRKLYLKVMHTQTVNVPGPAPAALPDPAGVPANLSSAPPGLPSALDPPPSVASLFCNATPTTPPTFSTRTPTKKVLGTMMPPPPCATWWPLKVEELIRSNSPDFDENLKSGSFR